MPAFMRALLKLRTSWIYFLKCCRPSKIPVKFVKLRSVAGSPSENNPELLVAHTENDVKSKDPKIIFILYE